MTAYEMRMSDWSSDMCSSDLGATAPWLRTRAGGCVPGQLQLFELVLHRPVPCCRAADRQDLRAPGAAPGLRAAGDDAGRIDRRCLTCVSGDAAADRCRANHAGTGAARGVTGRIGNWDKGREGEGG